jgi:hypothetical protein
MAFSKGDFWKNTGVSLGLILKNWSEKPGLASKSTMRTEEKTIFIPHSLRSKIPLFDKKGTGEILRRRENHGTKN